MVQKCVYSNTSTCWDQGLYGHKPLSFPPNWSPKMRESQHLDFGLRLVRRKFEETLTSRNPKQNSPTLWQIFSSNESAPANRKKGFYTNRRRSRCIFAWSGSELWTLFKYSRSKLKKWKTFSGWRSFQGLSNGTTLMQIQPGRTLPL